MTAAADVPATPLDMDIVRDELLWAITDAITNHPRSQQVRIGPSEIGIECARRLGFKLAGVEPVNDRGVPWKPTIGTAMHTWLGAAMERANGLLGEMPAAVGGGPRFLIEQKVLVGQILGEDIDGDTDVFDRATGTVIDWKLVGPDQLRKYKKNGPGEQYRIQGHTYGRGWQLRGEHVQNVAVFFLPRDGELRLAHFWHEPYDEYAGPKALDRVEGIAKLTAALGRAALPLLPTASVWCRYCPHFLPASTDLQNSCPGHRVAGSPNPA